MGPVDGLVRLEGTPFPVLASPGAEMRATEVAARVDRAHRWMTDVIGFDPQVALWVLAPDDWVRLSGYPVFGFPHFVGDDTILTGSIPPPFFDDLVAALWPQLSEETRGDVEEVYGRPPRIHPFADMLAVHELCHLYHQQSGFWFPERWLSELFCNIGLEGYITEIEPDQIAVLRTFSAVAQDIDPQAFPVRDIHRMEAALEGGPMNYAWFQLLLHRAAIPIWQTGGASVLRRLFDRFRDGSHPADLRQALADDVDPSVARVIDDLPA